MNLGASVSLMPYISYIGVVIWLLSLSASYVIFSIKSCAFYHDNDIYQNLQFFFIFFKLWRKTPFWLSGGDAIVTELRAVKYNYLKNLMVNLKKKRIRDVKSLFLIQFFNEYLSNLVSPALQVNNVPK
jgi:hypothetical protein